MPVVGPDFVFLCVPRTATNLMARKFLPQFGGGIVEPFHSQTPPAGMEDRFCFATVRNPYDQLLSCWYHNRRHSPSIAVRHMGLMEFLREALTISEWVSQSEFLSKARLDVVLQFENLSAEVLTLPFNRRRIPLPQERINGEDRPPWKEDLTPEFVEAVNILCEPDFAEFGYKMMAPGMVTKS